MTCGKHIHIIQTAHLQIIPGENIFQNDQV